MYLHGKKVGRVCIIVILHRGGKRDNVTRYETPSISMPDAIQFFKGNHFGVCDQVSGIRASVYSLIVTNNESENMVT